MAGTTHFNVRVGGGKQFESGGTFSFNEATHGVKQFSLQACKRGGRFSSSTCSRWVSFYHPIDTPLARGSVQYGADMPGGDYKNFDIGGSAHGPCQAACQNDTNCRAWTFVKPGIQGPSARYWLKNSVSERAKAQGRRPDRVDQLVGIFSQQKRFLHPPAGLYRTQGSGDGPCDYCYAIQRVSGG
jgi:hypothetical protein